MPEVHSQFDVDGSRLTPDLYTIATAAQQILGDQYAIHLIETARNYPFEEELGLQQVTLV